MRSKRSEEPESAIPYFQIRRAVEQRYNRRERIRKQGIWSLIISPLLAGAYFIQTPSADWSMALAVAVLGGLAIWIILIGGGLLVEQVDYSARESVLVKQCINEIRDRSFDTPPDLQALRESAAGAGEAVQVRTPLPLAIVAAMIAIGGLNLPVTIAVVLFELGVLMLLYLVVVSGQANADLIIRTAIIEIQRQAKLTPMIETPARPALPVVEAQPQTNGKHEQAKPQA